MTQNLPTGDKIMIYLVGAVISSALIPILFKLAHQHKVQEAIVITLNYFVITIFMGYIVLRNNWLFQGEVLLSETPDLLSFFTSKFGLSILIGVLTGALFYFSFYYYQKAVRQSGATMAGAFGKIGILIPVLLSLLVFREYPTTKQWIGIILAIVAILYISIDFSAFKLSKIHPVLIVLLFIGGFADFGNKIFQTYSDVAYKEVFLFIVFFTALLLSLKQFFKQKNFRKWDLITGITIGFPNLLSSFFLVMALNNMLAVVVFPLFSASTIVLVSLLSFFLFKEKLERKEYIGIFLIILSVLLIS